MLREGTYIASRYEVVGKAGSGGMADVYKAKDHILGRFVGIKVLKPEFSEDVNFVTKFRTEAQSAAVLEHPNIVNVYDVGDEQNINYIVMELVEGITLKSYIERKGRLTVKEATSIAIQVGAGLEIVDGPPCLANLLKNAPSSDTAMLCARRCNESLIRLVT